MNKRLASFCYAKIGIPDVFSASRPNGNSEMALSVDEIHDLLRDYFEGFVDYNVE